MYPNLYYAFKDIFGVEWSWLKLFNSFGFFVAMCFIAAAGVISLELKRKQSLGLLTYTEKNIVVGKQASLSDLITNLIIGFIVGFKLLGILTIPNALDDTQGFIISSQGNLVLGIIVALVFAGLKWWEMNNEKLETPEQRIIRIWPHDRVADVLFLAAAFGFIGAKIFNALETWEDFIKDPIGSLVSFSGLTFYGGLILATVAIVIYLKHLKISIHHFTDAAAPALMLGYGIGRIGCQIAGDGDWGILNSAYISNNDGKLIKATAQQFASTFENNRMYFGHRFGSITAVHHLNFPSFWGLPNWLFAYNYPHNVINEGIGFANCDSQFCSYLPIGVFPTPMYESLVCISLFIFLFSLRKKIKTPGKLFSIYLFFNGLERFFIEKIRVNTYYSFGSFHITQAEIISSLLMLLGIGLYIYSNKRANLSKSALSK